MTREDASADCRLGRAGAWLLMLLVCASAGCGNHSNVGALPPPLAAAPRAPAAAAAARTSDGAVQVTPTIKLYGTLSPEELEACYSVPQITNVGLPRPGPASASSAAPAEVPVLAAGAGWDVRLGRNWRHIVIHHSATATGSAASFDREHRERGWEGLGYHFVIGNGTGTGDGQVEVGYRWRNQQRGAHAGNLEYNEYGIGICLVGDFAPDGQPPRAGPLPPGQVRHLDGQHHRPLGRAGQRDPLPRPELLRGGVPRRPGRRTGQRAGRRAADLARAARPRHACPRQPQRASRLR